jgi:hypothetical protein
MASSVASVTYAPSASMRSVASPAASSTIFSSTGAAAASPIEASARTA